MRARFIGCVALILAAGLRAATLVVDLQGGGDFAAIQPAIDAAAAGDEVLVKPGEYVITVPITFLGKAITVRGEAGADATVIRMAEQAADPDRASVVVFESGETEASALEGFTLSGGRGTKWGSEWESGGGGILCIKTSSPTLTDCTVSGNTYRGDGGGMCCREGSSPTLRGCTISGNSCDVDGESGGGVSCDSSSPSFVNCVISGNSARTHGGGVYSNGSSPTFADCRISGNDWCNFGGGVSCAGGSLPVLTNCMISGNRAYCGGGVYCADNSSPTLTNCAISGNSAMHSGGGISCGASTTLTNCTISRNSVAAWRSPDTSVKGGGVYCAGSPILTNCTISANTVGGDRGSGGGGVACGENSSPTMTNCTISGNAASDFGGGVYCETASSPIITSCIVWGNGPGSLLIAGQDSQPVVTFSCLETEERWPGEGNINGNPLFCGFAGPRDMYVDASAAEGGDGSAERPFRDLASALEYSLSLMRENSPCIGTGKGGANMGAGLGTCEARESIERVAHLVPGRYSMKGITLVHGAGILGQAAEDTVLEGTVWGLRTGAVLSRVTVTGGTCGGIVIGLSESPAIEDCTITANAAGWGGGGVYCSGSSPAVRDCTISGNSASYGGGVRCERGASPVFTNCTISGNSSGGFLHLGIGGGVSCIASSPIFANCSISGNYTREHGGGVYCFLNPGPIFRNCTISHNSAYDSGGGVYCWRSSPTFADCRISGNWVSRTTTSDGGGVYCLASSPALTNCMIFGNRAARGGGMLCVTSSSPTLTNCTISSNQALSFGGGVYCGSSSPTLTNSIIWGNTPESVCGTLSHCLTNCDPLFVHSGVFDFTRFVKAEIGGEEYSLPDFIVVAPDYRLQPGSPAIDAGTCVGAPATDIEGAPRPQGAGCDIGAYEYPAGVVISFVRGDTNSDRRVDLSDVITVLRYLFAARAAPSCLRTADANDNGAVDIADAVYILGYLFGGGPVLPAPFPGCGFDGTADTLDCERYAPCEG
ncbi:MAG TPA: hypothetical protein DCM87_19025 [Planctomycetes bacterium]|nr:hypothetical protein [Planctomycetota bacterium]